MRDLEPRPHERPNPREHEDRFKPLLAIQHDVNRLSTLFTLVEKMDGTEYPSIPDWMSLRLSLRDQMLLRWKPGSRFQIS